MGIELESETRIVIGHLAAPTDPKRAWWWQSTTKLDGVELIVAGLARTESDAILEAAARTLDLRAASDRPAAPTAPAPPDAWGLNGGSPPGHEPTQRGRPPTDPNGKQGGATRRATAGGSSRKPRGSE